ncbi:PREDICTED: probable pectinesterase/pectinesterase inhibitor 36 [Camelina sativa]|uniref:Pectinesterase n=1 Tax=Camelina sativa TaxID=90675 RepID=A0ABM1RPP9_CAMSA|nr:PREDICTED: probable pectinesterase/pectinesterase inhibitor 36 [Camelina sativa]
MYTFVKVTKLITIMFFLAIAVLVTASSTAELDVLEMARTAVVEARTRFASMAVVESEVATSGHYYLGLSECEKLYDESEARLSKLVEAHENFTVEDIRTWLSGVLANHNTCLDGLVQERQGHDMPLVHRNVTFVLHEALAFYKKSRGHMKKSKNIRDMTFENTAGPHKHQAVALRVNSDLSLFYRCSFKGYQDTLFTHSLRQFYRDCHIYGTIDFIFGDAAAVFQNCDIFVRRPMDHQGNMITAQGRDDPHATTGISIQHSRVRAAPEFEAVKGRFKNYLGRPWKKYSRTVFLKTDLDGLIDPRGWREWSGSYALSTLYYGEFMNTGAGAETTRRVNWPGFHVLRGEEEASPFTVSRFIQGDSWIPITGVPFSAGV